MASLQPPPPSLLKGGGGQLPDFLLELGINLKRGVDVEIMQVRTTVAFMQVLRWFILLQLC